MPRRASRKIDEWSKWARAARHSTGLNQTVFGQSIKRSRGAIADWERGANKPDLASIETILKKFPKVPRPPTAAAAAVSDPERTVSLSDNAGAYVTGSEEAATVARQIDRIEDEGLRMRARDVALAAITEALHPSELGAEQDGRTTPSGR